MNLISTVKGYRKTGGGVVIIDGRRYTVSLKRYKWVRERALKLKLGGWSSYNGFEVRIRRMGRRHDKGNVFPLHEPLP